MVRLAHGPDADRMARRPPNRPADVVVAVVIALAAVSGPAVGYLIRHIEFCCGSTQPTTSLEYSTSALAEAFGVALLVVVGGFVVVVLRRGAPRLWLLIGVLSAVQVALALVHQHQAGTAPVNLTPLDPRTAVIFLLYTPTSWPLLVLAVGSLVIVILRVRGRRQWRHEKVGT
jgi:hypothetical protein